MDGEIGSARGRALRRLGKGGGNAIERNAALLEGAIGQGHPLKDRRQQAEQRVIGDEDPNRQAPGARFSGGDQ